MSDRRIVITGLGAICCLGNDVPTIWDAILHCRSGIGPITLFDVAPFDVRFGGQCWNFDPEKWLSKRESRRLDRFAQMAVAASDMAIADSGLDMLRVDRSRFGCILGSGIGGLAEIENQHKELMTRGPGRVSPFLIPKLMVNAAPGQVSIRHGLRGPNQAVVTACASASHAIGDAMMAIRRDLADVLVTGGSEAALTPLGIAGFCSLKALSTRNEHPTQASRPFDRDRDGFVMAEGAGCAIIEELQHALARRARIYAELIGFGMSGDGCHITAPDPDGAGPARAMMEALRDARIGPDAVQYINAHGTSTPLNDSIETRAIHRVFGPHAPRLAVSSTKSQMGHLLGASGGVELVVIALAIHQQIAPPTINYETPDPECDLNYVPNAPQPMPIEIAMSNSFGFGGHNATLIARRFA
ncbi:MAG: beta-ketoacyl-ACP synthase II [Planctomycetes bacterium]|nr:beta-ketoacyl-ACP synthase II [Planctomycetota bacterium]